MSNAVLRLALAVVVTTPGALSACGSVGLDAELDAGAGGTAVPDSPVAPRPVDVESRLKPIPLADLAERLSSALCQALDRCCQAAALGSSGADCQEQTQTNYQSLLTATSATAVHYDPIAGARCVAAFTHFLNGCSYDGKPESDAACRTLFRGTRALDESCESDAECAARVDSDVYCAGDLGPNPHTCQRALPEGEPCLLEGCAKGLFCDLATLSCQPQHSSGECLDFETCSDESVCSPRGLCEAKLASGQPCVLDLQCQNGACGADGRCAGSLANSYNCASP